MCARSFIARGLILAVALIALVTAARAQRFQPTDPNGPTANAPQYPLGLSDVGTRLEEASVAWYQLSQRYGLPGKTEANLHPYTATSRACPRIFRRPYISRRSVQKQIQLKKRHANRCAGSSSNGND